MLKHTCGTTTFWLESLTNDGGFFVVERLFVNGRLVLGCASDAVDFDLLTDVTFPVVDFFCNDGRIATASAEPEEVFGRDAGFFNGDVICLTNDSAFAADCRFAKGGASLKMHKYFHTTLYMQYVKYSLE